MRDNPRHRDADDRRQEATQWMKVAEQIKTEDPEAYEYLHGRQRDMDRIGAGFIAMLAAVHVRDVRPHRVAAGAARLPDLPLGGDRGADPRHGRPPAPGQRRLPPAGQRGRRRRVQHRHLRHRRGHLPVRRRPDHEHRRPCPAGSRSCWSGCAAWSAGCCCGPTGGSPSSAARTAARRSRSAGSWHRRFFRDMRDAREARRRRAGRHRRAEWAGADGRRREQTNLRPEARLEDPAHARRTAAAEGRRADGRRAPTVETGPTSAGGYGSGRRRQVRPRPDAGSRRPGPSPTCRSETRRS